MSNKKSHINNKLTGIYKITNMVNEKVYIGSSINFNKRHNEHFNMLKNKTHHSSKLQNAFNKYGLNNFKFEILELCDKDMLLEREQFWLNELNAYKEGYNCSIDVVRPMLGKTHSEETKQKMRKKHKTFSIDMDKRRFGEDNPMYGIKRSNKIRKILDKTGMKHSEETKQKMSLSRLGNTRSRKKIVLLTLNNTHIKEYVSLTEASKDLNIKIYVISNILRNKRNNVGNYKFIYG